MISRFQTGKHRSTNKRNYINLPRTFLAKHSMLSYFTTSTVIEPEILIIDEIPGAGDGNYIFSVGLFQSAFEESQRYDAIDRSFEFKIGRSIGIEYPTRSCAYGCISYSLCIDFRVDGNDQGKNGNKDIQELSCIKEKTISGQPLLVAWVLFQYDRSG